MRVILILVILFLTKASIICQTLITERDTIVWQYKNGYTYNFEWTDEGDDDKLFQDTIYAIQFFPPKNDWKVYFDANKTKVATLVHYDLNNKTINTKHFNRQGKLIKELQANYFDSKNYNPAFIKVKNVIYLKAYLNDSLIYEIQGFKTSLFIKYKNYITKRRFEKRIYYVEGEYHDEEIGETVKNFYEDGTLKSICNGDIKKETDKEGNEVTFIIFTCDNFDKNGCIIKDK